MAATLSSRFAYPNFRPFRVALYSGLGLPAVVFVLHGVALHGLAEQNMLMSLDWMALMAALNCVGAAVYAARVRLLRFSLILLANRCFEQRYQSDGTNTRLTSSVRVIRRFTSWSYWRAWRILLA